MHSPNPMFPKDSSRLMTQVSPTSPTAWYLGNAPSLDSVNLNKSYPKSPATHRRANSDFSGMPALAPRAYNMQTLTSKRVGELTPAGESTSARRSSQSRIPISTRRYSYTSDSGHSPQSSRPSTRMSQARNTPIVAKSDSRRSPPNNNGTAAHHTVGSQENSSRITTTSPKKKPQTPLRIKSPKRPDGSNQPAEKSPSLRANIIAPPPKVSPPLRSSRPRQPVSTASTAASRAKMVERIGSMQSSTPSPITTRRRPPELKDVDLAARRQRITQAFNRTVEEEKRKTQLRESESRSNLANSEGTARARVPGKAPAIVVDSPLHETPDHDVFTTPTEENPEPLPLPTTQRPVHEEREADSPTLGISTNGELQHLRISPQESDGTEPLSAVTAETDGTNFENEPQVTLANHVMQMRSPAAQSSSRSDSSNESDRASDGADQESIQIMLRNTAYYDEHDEPPHVQNFDDAAHLDESSRNSWTSSIADGHSPASPSHRMGEGRAIQNFSSDDAAYADEWPSATFPESPVLGRSLVQGGIAHTSGDEQEPSQRLSNQHRHNNSLASVQDWEADSPSDRDWKSFGTVTFRQADQEIYGNPPALPPKDLRRDPSPNGFSSAPDGLGLSVHESPFATLPSPSPPPRPPSHSPPPVPSHEPRTIDEATANNAHSPSVYSSQPPSSTFSPAVGPPKVPRRVTSLTQIENKLDGGTKPWANSIAEERPSFEQPSLTSSSKRSSPTPEQRRLRKRRHVIKELIDTEFTFGRDMRVVIDIYKETLGSCLTLTADDVKILFGNIDQVAHFSFEFLDSLKKAGKAIYVMPRSERFLNKREAQQETQSLTAESAFTTLTPDQSSIMEAEAPDPDNDRLTSIGDVFKRHMAEMEDVYTRYLKNHDSANKKLQALQQTNDVKIWLESCQSYSKDLTSAWNLDSLLVKPVQRILKYPLLLQQLIESTPEDHPDHNSLLESLRELTRVSMEINEKTKQSNLVNQALNRKRKDSDVRTGLSKAFGRRTEKLKQHVGISEMVEDKVYNDLKDRYIENYGQLVVVGSDIRKYKTSVTKWVEHLSDFAAAADGWVDVHHSPWPELESKLRQFSMTVREVAAHALPGHLVAIQKSVIDPMFRSATMLESLQKDPKGLFQKRDKKLIDYARYSNMKERGDKLDKKTIERMEQWEALNREAKERMEKLIFLTAELVCRCLRTFIQIHLRWLDIWKRRLPSPMNVTETEIAQIEKDWQQDFDYQEASALSMSICNGSLLAEAVNMVNFLSPATNGDESPRQQSRASSNKRSISLNSEGSPALATSYKRNSGSFNMSPMFDESVDRGASSAANGFLRAPSLPSGTDAGPSETSTYGTSVSPQSTAVSTVRPSTSMGRSPSSQRVPRLSLDAPSPYFGPLRTTSPATRPESTSTFYSTSAGPSNAMPSPPAQNLATGSPAGPPPAVFSSAMPMSDSPITGEPSTGGTATRSYDVLFPVASVYEFNIDRARREAGFPYLTYVTGEIFDVIGERGELWLAKNQDDPQQQIGWIWNKHFARLDQ
jgi:hypothetical protein